MIEAFGEQRVDATPHGSIAAPHEQSIHVALLDEFDDLLRRLLALGDLPPRRIGMTGIGERCAEFLQAVAGEQLCPG